MLAREDMFRSVCEWFSRPEIHTNLQWLHHASSTLHLCEILLLLIASWGTWKHRQESRRRHRLQAQPITLTLVTVDGRRLTLPYKPRRDQLTRDELVGILTLYAGHDGFYFPRLVEVFESGHFNAMHAGKAHELFVPCPEREYDCFRKFIEREQCEPPLKEHKTA